MASRKHNPRWLLLIGVVFALAQSIPAAAQTDTISTVNPEDVYQIVAENAGKVVIVNFWASWCPPCLKEFPDIIRAYDDYHSQGLEVIAVSMNAGDEIEDIEAFLENYDPPFPVYRAATLDETFFEGISENWFGEMPTTLIFDALGNTTHLYKKQVTYDELANDVTALLAMPDIVD